MVRRRNQKREAISTIHDFVICRDIDDAGSGDVGDGADADDDDDDGGADVAGGDGDGADVVDAGGDDFTKLVISKMWIRLLGCMFGNVCVGLSSMNYCVTRNDIFIGKCGDKICSGFVTLFVLI